MKYDNLVSELEKEGVEVIEHKFYSSALKGLYFDNVIAINCKGIATEKEKTCILAEEYGQLSYIVWEHPKPEKHVQRQARKACSKLGLREISIA